ncbi:MAG: SMC-Scp complex subunit ScpB [Candidatus Latescibacteria bacterium]|nr:SMC-Scp complex subunit ScpB [Candidatus Latescibacterota bacterium]
MTENNQIPETKDIDKVMTIANDNTEKTASAQVINSDIKNDAPADSSSNASNLKNIVEALLFSENNPLTLTRLTEITNAPNEDIVNVMAELNKDYQTTNRTFRIEKVANGYQLYTLPEYSQWVRLLYKTSYHRLSRPALETLAIVIYNQPVTRPEIEKFRGVDCSGPLLTLLERKLIRIEGRAKKPGGPFLYGTGKEFLRYFGLASLNDLPNKEELGTFLQRRSEEL